MTDVKTEVQMDTTIRHRPPAKPRYTLETGEEIVFLKPLEMAKGFRVDTVYISADDLCAYLTSNDPIKTIKRLVDWLQKERFLQRKTINEHHERQLQYDLEAARKLLRKHGELE